VKPRAALIRANIEIVQALVEALIESGSLSGEQINSIISREAVLRSIKLERRRRADWQRTTESAARFTSDHKTQI
jgi:hypothetical protein